MKMKKPDSTRLAVRRETVRALVTLELVQVVGGDTELVQPSVTCQAVCGSLIAKPAGG